MHKNLRTKTSRPLFVFNGHVSKRNAVLFLYMDDLHWSIMFYQMMPTSEVFHIPHLALQHDKLNDDLFCINSCLACAFNMFISSRFNLDFKYFFIFSLNLFRFGQFWTFWKFNQTKINFNKNLACIENGRMA